MRLPMGSMREYAQWAAMVDDDLDVGGFLHHVIGPATLCAAAELILPRLVEYRGCALLAIKHDEASVDEWLRSTGGVVAAVEAVVNHVHLWDVVTGLDDTDAEALEDLAQRIGRSWEHAAADWLPHRDLVIEVSDDYGPTITLRSRTPDDPPRQG